MKRIILILFATVLLIGCSTIDEDNSNCFPDGNIYVSFSHRDDHNSESVGDYDSRIGNEVMLYFFKDNLLTYAELVPYDKIRGQAEYMIRKTPDVTGNIEIVSWAVPAGKSLGDYHLRYAHGSSLQNHFLTHERTTRADDLYRPLNHELYLGRISTTEVSGEDSHHEVSMMVAGCRIVVNITDNHGILQSLGGNPRIEIDGIMSQMDLYKQGAGTPAIVTTPLQSSSDGVQYTTGQFGVSPSASGQVVRAKIIAGNTVVATLALPENRRAISGGLMVFNYELSATYFEIIIDDWTEKLYTVEYL